MSLLRPGTIDATYGSSARDGWIGTLGSEDADHPAERVGPVARIRVGRSSGRVGLAIFIDGEGGKREGEGPGPPGPPPLRCAARRVNRTFRRAELLSRTAWSGEALPPEVRTAVREACMRRVLLLRNFFYREPAEEAAGVRAADYFEDPAAWERIRPPPGPLLAERLDALSDEVAPSLGPAAPGRIPEDAWPLLELVSAVGSVFDAFLDALPDGRSGWFSDRAGGPAP